MFIGAAIAGLVHFHVVNLSLAAPPPAPPTGCGAPDAHDFCNGITAPDTCDSTDPDICAGDNTIDICKSGAASEDVCEPKGASHDADHCDPLEPDTDVCEPKPGSTDKDYCTPSDSAVHDVCIPTGPKQDPDVCAPPGNPDDCHKATKDAIDLCDPVAAGDPDVCKDGTGAPQAPDQCEPGAGDPDVCIPEVGEEDRCSVFGDQSDVCTPDGAEPDDCKPSGFNGAQPQDFCTPQNGDPDECDAAPNVTVEDTCNPTAQNADACEPANTGDNDECDPNGTGDPDTCNFGASGSQGDLCQPLIGDTDECVAGSEEDLCGQGAPAGDPDTCCTSGDNVEDVCGPGGDKEDLPN